MNRRITLMGYGPAMSWPTARTVDGADSAAVMDIAREMLESSPDYDRVEVWSDQEQIHILRRGAD